MRKRDFSGRQSQAPLGSCGNSGIPQGQRAPGRPQGRKRLPCGRRGCILNLGYGTCRATRTSFYYSYSARCWQAMMKAVVLDKKPHGTAHLPKGSRAAFHAVVIPACLSRDTLSAGPASAPIPERTFRRATLAAWRLQGKHGCHPIPRDRTDRRKTSRIQTALLRC